MVMTDEASRIVLVNTQTETIFGYTRGELLGQPVEMLVPERFRAAHPEDRNAFFAQPRPPSMGTGRELFGLRKDGTEIPVEIGLNPIDTKDGRFVLAAIVDISERKQAVAKLQQLADDLARSNKDLEHFAYLASHDLQEPLRKIRSFTELLARRYQGKLDAEADTFIGYVVDGVRRLQQLIDDLLAYSRAGRAEMPKDAVHVGELVQQVLRDLERPIKESGAQIDIGEMPVVHGSRTMLRQVFQNLVSNAAKFRSDQSLRIRVWAERDSAGWRFGVSDNGIGIPPEAFDRIFLVFQRLHTRQEYPGTGIGLSVCKRIVERHGGKIWVVSAQGRGSIFFFTIPDLDATPFAELETSTRSVAGDSTGRDEPGMKEGSGPA
jgi:PAS domain S-box-containing protein